MLIHDVNFFLLSPHFLFRILHLEIPLGSADDIFKILKLFLENVPYENKKLIDNILYNT